MSRLREEKLSEQLSLRIPRSLYESLDEVARQDRRKLSEVGLALLERGYAAYERDGRLFEPEELPAPPPEVQDHSADQSALFSGGDLTSGRKTTVSAQNRRKDIEDATQLADELNARKRVKE
jgi:hypothetical protein